jgi:predicted ATP-dependent endonuclease of OLD family
MNLKTIKIGNYRRLASAKIDFEEKTTIFVGANNSGKTSATSALRAFLDGKQDFSLYDFSASCWTEIEKIGSSSSITTDIHTLPKITLDLWFTVDSQDIADVIEILPGLDWVDTPVGIRLEYAPRDHEILLANFQKAFVESQGRKKEDYQPWPISLVDYLQKKITSEYKVHYWVLDWSYFDSDLRQAAGYIPKKLGDDRDNAGHAIVKSILRVDFLNAQRHLADNNITGRSEDLSKRLNRFYDRNLEKRGDDIDAMKALAESEKQLSNHFEMVFKPTIENLNKMGYPGFSNPKLIVKATMSFENVGQSARLHYSLGGLELPDKYNGLGFKNLIFMVVEIMDFHERWIEEKEKRPPLHLILIEEPEVHLHAQLQQVFINQIWNIISGSDVIGFNSQLILTTHSPHIIYESGFKPIRYFKRCADDLDHPTTDVLNLSFFYNNDKDDTKDFLQRYMKLIHCDLFFADAAILVEGTVERLLLPIMIEKSAVALQSNYLSVIEVGGAYAHRFKDLIEFLGLTTLVITDIDSVLAVEKDDAKEEDADEDIEDEENEGSEEEKSIKSSACIVGTTGAVTSNQTLKKWLPKIAEIEKLIVVKESERTQRKSDKCPATAQICFQDPIDVTWKKETEKLTGRTFEEAFTLQNIDWCQDIKQKGLGVRVVSKKVTPSLADLHAKLFKRIKGTGFKKTEFALGLLMTEPGEWKVPQYIDHGLKWLAEELSTNEALNVEVKLSIEEADVVEKATSKIVSDKTLPVFDPEEHDK